MEYLILIQNLNSASGVCVKQVASELRMNGDRVWIITESPIGEENHHIISIHNKTSFNNNFSRLLHRIKTIFLYPIWPRQHILFYYKLYSVTKRFINNHKIDGIICVYNSVETLMVGHRIKTSNPHIKYIPYFLDALYGGQKPFLMTEKYKKRKALNVEGKLLENADQIIMMASSENAYIQDNITPSYLAKTTFLDIPLFCPVRYNINQRKFFPEDTVNLFYCGSMPNNVRNPRAFLDIFTIIDNDKFHLYLAGTSDYENLLIDAASKCSRIHLLGTISHSQAKEMIKEADMLINIGNSLPYMVPSKIFEYISYGKRVISTYRINNDPCIGYLNKYQSALLINENDDCYKSAKAIIDFYTSTSDYCSPSSEVFYRNSPQAFCKCISKLFNKQML